MKNVKKQSKLLFIIIAVCCIVAILSIACADMRGSSYAEAYDGGTKYYCNATIEESFADNRIIVVMSSQDIDGLRNFTAEDFPGIPILEIEELTSTSNNIQNQADGEGYQTTLCLILDFNDKQKVLHYIKVLENRDDVICAEPDYFLEPNFDAYYLEPNDEYYMINQWGLNGEFGINAPGAWNTTTGSFSIKVGVIDSGIDVNHEDLKNRVNVNLSRSFLNANESGTSALTDTHGHGTHVAGIIGAQGNNSVGITGVNLNVDLVSLKIKEGDSINSFMSKLISVVDYAIDNDIQILNNSNCLVDPVDSTNALDFALNRYTGLFINSAGNKGYDLDENYIIPCSSDLPNVMVVGAINKMGQRWTDFQTKKESNYSSTKVHVYAPGGNIMSTYKGVSNYGYMSGTSMAAPFVAGAAALLLSVNPNLTGAQLKTLLIDSAENITIDKGAVKKLNAYNAIQQDFDILRTTNLSDTEIRIDGFKPHIKGKFEIPSALNGRNVTEIGDSAFESQHDITEFILPNTLLKIGIAAFGNCTHLENVSISPFSKLQQISLTAFQQCLRLKSIVLPSSITSIADGAFVGSENLTIYTECTTTPTTWGELWNRSEWMSVERPVIWGCTLSKDKSYVVSFFKSSTSITKANAPNGISAPFRKGYTFGGWYNNSSFTGTAISAGEIANAPNAVTYYAKWIPNHIVTFDSNYYKGDQEFITVKNGEKVGKPVKYPTMEGYVFKYWALSTDLSQEYNWNTTVTTDIIIKAVWDAVGNNHIVTFDLDGGKGDFNVQQVVPNGATVSRPPTPTKVGYRFKYWALSGDISSYNFNAPVTFNITLKAIWEATTTYTVTFNSTESNESYPRVIVNSGDHVDKPIDPVAQWFRFKYWALSSNLREEYNWNSSIYENITLMAVWEDISCYVSFDVNGGTENDMLYVGLTLYKGDTIGEFINKDPQSYVTTKTGYTFKYWALSTNLDTAYDMNATVTRDITLQAVWQINTYSVSFNLNGGSGSCPTQTVKHGATAYAPSNPSRSDYTFKYWAISGQSSAYDFNTPVTSNLSLVAIWEKKECVAEGTLITLADGTQKPVEQLTGDEMLLVWNLNTGAFDVAPILFVDKDPRGMYEVVNLSFSDGTAVKVISEHAFWDFDLNKYVYLDENASAYIGHWFNKQTLNEDGSMGYTRVQLVGVEVKDEETRAYSPVTYSHLCYYVNGMLSMPGGISGLFNIFEVDAETLKIDEQKMQEDIETYGLFTYEEFASIVPVSEEVFNAFNGQYLKVAIGKGMITIERLQYLVERYAEFFV